jgi:P4 family phage/plasmid primase-like protien
MQNHKKVDKTLEEIFEVDDGVGSIFALSSTNEDVFRWLKDVLGLNLNLGFVHNEVVYAIFAVENDEVDVQNKSKIFGKDLDVVCQRDLMSVLYNTEVGHRMSQSSHGRILSFTPKGFVSILQAPNDIQTALADELTIVATADKEEVLEHLTLAATSVFPLLGDVDEHADAVRNALALLGVNRLGELQEEAVYSAISRGEGLAEHSLARRKGLKQAANPVQQIPLSLPRIPVPAPSQEDGAEPAPFPFDEQGNVRRFVQACGQHVLFDHEKNRWMIFDGKRFVPDDDDAIHEIANKVVDLIKADADSLFDERARTAAFKWHAASSRRYGRDALILNARQTARELKVRTSDFDRDPNLLNVQNGTIDLREGRPNQHDASDKLSRIADVRYDHDATCPEFEKALHRSIGDPDVERFFQRSLGYTLCGHTKEQCLFMVVGEGANGKSVLTKAIQELLDGYAGNADYSTFELDTRKSPDKPRNDLVRLAGMRMIVTSEGGKGARLNEPLMKVMTGGDKITARALYGHQKEFDLVGKIWLVTNHKPILNADDFAIWRRIHVIDFGQAIPLQERDPELPAKLRAERSGILNWLLEGYRQYVKEGLNPPAAVERWKEEYRTSLDPVAAFIDERCERGPMYRVDAMSLFVAYVEWCQENGVIAPSQHLFGKALGGLAARLGIEKLKSSTIHWTGIRLTGAA